MATLIVGAIILGAGASVALAFAAFYVALTSAVVLGVVVAVAKGASLAAILLPGFALLVVTQLAYGSGLLLQAALARLSSSWARTFGRPTLSLTRRSRPADQRAPPAHRVR